MRQRVTALVLALIMTATAAFTYNWEGPAARIKKSVQRVDIPVHDVFGHEGHGACTAFSINDFRDYFLTAAHCYGEKMLVGGHEARMVYLNRKADLMVLVVPESGEVPEVRPAKEHECKDGSINATCQGNEVAAMGYGFGVMFPILKTGNVGAVDVDMSDWGFAQGERMLLSGFSYIPGMSGGPVFDRDGRIVGIVQWGDNDNYVGGGRTLKGIMALTSQFWGVNDNKR